MIGSTENYYSEPTPPELNESKPVPWWRRGPNAGLVSFGPDAHHTFGGRVPDGVGCWLIGRICAALDKACGLEIVESKRVVEKAWEVVSKASEKIREDNRFRWRYRIISFAEIQPEPVEMIIDPILPRGEVTILDGDPGAGKSWLWVAFLAGLTGSKVCPLPEPLNVGASNIHSALLLTTEDDPKRIIWQRLDWLGADRERIRVVEFKNEDEMFFTASDARDIRRLVQKATPDIVIIDPITLYASTEKGFDSNTATKVRKMLTPLIKVARETNCAFLVNRHFRKTSGKAMHQGIGSIDYAATARSLLMVVKDQADPLGNPRIMAHIKSTASSEMSGGLLFSLNENQTPPFHWEGRCEINADELTNYEGASNARDDRSRTGEAKDFLHEILTAGQPVLVQECREQAYRLGIAETTLLRAKRALGVKAKQSGFGEDKEWFWCLE
jgi:hypothetical protein